MNVGALYSKVEEICFAALMGKHFHTKLFERVAAAAFSMIEQQL